MAPGRCRTGTMAGQRGAGLLRLPRRAHQLPSPLGVPAPRCRTLAARLAQAQPEGSNVVDRYGPAGGSLAAQTPDIPSLAVSALSRQTPKVGAVCGNSARTVLCGGRSVMGVPTAITGQKRLRAAREVEVVVDLFHSLRVG